MSEQIISHEENDEIAYKVREARRPKTAAELRRDGETKVFFNQYVPK